MGRARQSWATQRGELVDPAFHVGMKRERGRYKVALEQGVLDAVSNSNFKSIAEMGVINALQSQQRLSILGEKALAKSLESMDNTSVAEGLGEAISATVGFQQAIKSAGNTPPVTP